MITYSEAMTRDLRLTLLQSLNRMSDYRLSDRMLVYQAQADGHRRSIDAIRGEMRALAELGAVKLVQDNEDVLVAEITRLGRNHVRRLGIVEGVSRPEPGE